MKRLINAGSISVLLGLGLCSNAYAWWDAGHMVVADIAYHQLNAKAKAEVKKLLPIMDTESTDRNNYSFNTTNPNYTMMAISHWADDLNNYPNYLKVYKTWHYIEDAYSEDGTAIPSSIPRDNVVFAISNLRQHLAQKKGNDYDKVRSLALITHFAGDIHQPLHCAEYYADNFTAGDKGGNYFKISYKEPNGERIRNLHMLFDSGVRLFPSLGYSHDVTAPKDVDDIAVQIMEELPESYFGSQARDLDPEHWQAESHSLAIDAHHTALYKTPTNDYLEKQTDVVKKQMALAGYRLGNLLNEVLG